MNADPDPAIQMLLSLVYDFHLRHLDPKTGGRGADRGRFYARRRAPRVKKREPAAAAATAGTHSPHAAAPLAAVAAPGLAVAGRGTKGAAQPPA